MAAVARTPHRGAAMAAAVVVQPRSLRVESAPIPEPGPRDVLVRIEGCGVCGSNVPVWTGAAPVAYPLEPGEPGHEAWGVVEGVGSNVAGVRRGERVACLSYRSFAAYDVADAEAVVPLPRELEGRAFPGEALACAVNAFRRSGVRAGETVAVVGIGFLGALLTQLAARAGADVLAISRRPFARETARALGAAETLPLDGETVARVSELTNGTMCDRVLEAAGAQATLDVSAQLTRVRGTLVIAGYHQDGPRQVDMQLWNWRGLDVVNAHERDPAVYVRGLRAAAEAVAMGALDPDPLYTHRFPLERLDAALDAAAARPDGFMKALVEA